MIHAMPSEVYASDLRHLLLVFAPSQPSAGRRIVGWEAQGRGKGQYSCSFGGCAYDTDARGCTPATGVCALLPASGSDG